MPLVGQASARAEEASLGVAEHIAAEVILTPTLELMEPPLTLVASSVVGMVPQAKALASQAEVATTVTSQTPPDTATVVSKGATQSMLLVA